MHVYDLDLRFIAAAKRLAVLLPIVVALVVVELTVLWVWHCVPPTPVAHTTTVVYFEHGLTKKEYPTLRAKTRKETVYVLSHVR